MPPFLPQLGDPQGTDPTQGFQCLSGLGVGVAYGASTAAVTRPCNTQYPWTKATYAVGTDKTIRFYPMMQSQACLTADLSSGIARIAPCAADPTPTQTWVYTSGGLINWESTPYYIKANDPGQNVTLVTDANLASSFTFYQYPGETRLSLT